MALGCAWGGPGPVARFSYFDDVGTDLEVDAAGEGAS